MANVIVNYNIISNRGNLIRSLLSPISRLSDGPAWYKKPLQQKLIFGAHDGSPPNSDYREWRFDTYVSDFKAMYFEIWHKYNSHNLFLERAYLSIFKTDRITREEKEYICLHCDPNVIEQDNHFKYKRSPHIHIEAADHPIPKAHIALYNYDLDSILNSIDNYHRALILAIMMIKDEFLDLI